jgi:hypothetical protein
MRKGFRYAEEWDMTDGNEVYGIGREGKFQKGIIDGRHIIFKNESGGIKEWSKPIWNAEAFKYHTVYSDLYVKLPSIKPKKKRYELVVVEFYHPDDRINFFTIDHIVKPLIHTKELHFYVYQSSGLDWKNAYHITHQLQIFDKDVELVSDLLEKEGWRVFRPKNIKFWRQ